MDDSSSGLVKLYSTQVVKVTSSAGDVVELGDSSVQEKTKYTLQHGETAIQIHYEGFPEEQERWVVIEKDNPVSNLVVPYDCHRSAVRALHKFHCQGQTGAKLAYSGYLTQDRPVSIPPPTIDTPGAKRPKTTPGIPDEYYKKPAPRPSREERLRMKEEEQLKPKEAPKVKNGRGRKKRLDVEKEAEDYNWIQQICVECKEAESITAPDSILVICEGKCNRPFHESCVGLHRSLHSDEVWRCSDCLNQRHRCGICQEYGNDNEDVFCCEKKDCGMFFHESCLRMQNVDIRLVDRTGAFSPDEEKKELSDEEVGPTAVPVFTCPAHQCWACTEDYIPEEEEVDAVGPENGKSRGRRQKKRSSKELHAFAQKKEMILVSLFAACVQLNEVTAHVSIQQRCLECPIAYHPSCIPPVARFHELALLCHEHTTCKLPYLDASTSFQAEVEARAEKKLAKIFDKKSEAGSRKKRKFQEGDDENMFFPEMKGDGITADEGVFLERLDDADDVVASVRELTFCLPCDFVDEVSSMALTTFRPRFPQEQSHLNHDRRSSRSLLPTSTSIP
jgi:hypothetical protein